MGQGFIHAADGLRIPFREFRHSEALELSDSIPQRKCQTCFIPQRKLMSWCGLGVRVRGPQARAACSAGCGSLLTRVDSCRKPKQTHTHTPTHPHNIGKRPVEGTTRELVSCLHGFVSLNGSSQRLFLSWCERGANGERLNPFSGDPYFRQPRISWNIWLTEGNRCFFFEFIPAVFILKFLVLDSHVCSFLTDEASK